MITKTFLEMTKVDISKYIQKRDGISYLPWADCKFLLHRNGAERVFFEPLVDPITNSSLFKTDRIFGSEKDKNTNSCYEVAVKITIDDDVFVMRTPLMNGVSPVRDNSISQQRIWNSQARAFVKGVAMRTGLGFKLWMDNDIDAHEEDDLSRHNIMKIKERVRREYTNLMANDMSVREIAHALNMTEETVEMYFNYFNLIDEFEKKMLNIDPKQFVAS